MKTIKIEYIESDKNAPLYHRYPSQTNAQSAYIELDLESGTLKADWDGEIGGGVPFSVYYGHVQRFDFTLFATTKEINDFLDEIKPDCQEIQAGYDTAWNGNNWIAIFTDQARDTIEFLENKIRDFSDSIGNCVYVISDWSDWFMDLSEILSDLNLAIDLKDFEKDTESDIKSDGHILEADIDDLEGFLTETLESEIEEKETLADLDAFMKKLPAWITPKLKTAFDEQKKYLGE